jgi:thiamine-phosphate pyrophosphorylase
VRGLYAIVDVETLVKRGLDPLRFGRSVLDARPAAIQVRDKASGSGATLRLLRVLAPLAASVGVPLYVNDRPDLALLAGAHGVHVGQDDLPVEAARALAQSLGKALRVGLSTHNATQVEAALTPASPDYLAIGPVFSTASKPNASPALGLEQLATLSTRARAARPELPLVAIGGITHETAGAVAALIPAVAVIQALLPTHLTHLGASAYAEVTDRARSLHEIVERNAA